MEEKDNQIKRLQEMNPEVEIKNLKLTRKEDWDSLNLEGIDEKAVIMHVAKKQVLENLHPEQEVQGKLKENGLDSSAKIIRMTETEFIRKYREKLGISREEGEEIYQRAVKIQTKTMHLLASVRSTVASPYYRTMNTGMAGDQLQEYFERLPDYQELFGSLDYCNYDEQETVFGMPAYFADLMRITEKYITQPNRDSEKFCSLSLRTRRPDLEKIPLTKESAKKLVPYVRIILERLEYSMEQFFKEEGKNTGEKELYVKLAEAEYPFSCPFVLPLKQIRIALKKKGISLQELSRAWCVEKQAVQKEKLELSARLEQMLTGKSSAAEVAMRYGMEESQLDSLNHPENLQESAWIDHEKLLFLLEQDLTEEEKDLAALFYINQGLGEKEYFYLDEQGHLLNGCQDVFDRINRFLRLERETGLAGDHLDWLLRVLGSIGQIQSETLSKIGQFLELWERSNMDFYEFTSFFAPVKTYGENCLYDKIFDSYREGNRYHPAGGLNSHYTDETRIWSVDAGTENWLAGCLDIDIEDLESIRSCLFGQADVELSVDNLSVFYRYVRMAEVFDLSIRSYLDFLEVCGLDGRRVFTLDEVQKLFSVYESMKKNGVDLWQIQYLISGQESTYVKKPYTEKNLYTSLNSLWKQKIPHQEEDRETAQKKVLIGIAEFLCQAEEQMEAFSVCFPKPKGLSYWAQAFLTEPKSQGQEPLYWEYIKGVMELIGKCLFLVGQGLPLELVTDFYQNPEYYRKVKGGDTVLDGILNLYRMAGMIKSYNDIQLVRCLEWDEEAMKLLCDITQWQKAEVQKLTEGVLAEKSGVERLEGLQECFRIMRTLGADSRLTERLAALVTEEPEYGQISSVATDLLSLLQKMNAIQRAAEGEKRDVLLDMVLWNLHKKYPDIRTANDVYKYLLIDVEMDDTTQISYIKEAINAVQLYLQRCRMHLEQYAEKIEIEENWWSWLMSYRRWEANRKIFIYPENYVVPSVRSTKTSLFKEVEDGLQQSQIEDGYVEKLYIKYLDGYTTVSDLEICGAYQAVTGVNEKTLFLFGRSRKQPYQYFYCRQEQGMAYGEWKEINVGIHSEYITPVYIFHKLYVFWVEDKSDTRAVVKQDNSGILSSDEVSKKIDVKYTFLNLSGEWISPQTLIENQLIYFSSEETKKYTEETGSPFSGGFDQSDPAWRKVSVLRLSADNFSPYQEKGKDFERLCVFFGTFLHVTGKTIEVSPVAQDGSDRNLFLQERYEKGNRHNLLVNSLESGILGAGIAKIYNNMMEEDYCLQKQEFLILDAYSPDGSIHYRPLLDNVTHKVNLAYSNFPLMQELSLVTPKVQHKPEQMRSDSFVSAAIDFALSKEIYDLLAKEGLVNGTKLQEEKVLSADLRTILKPVLMSGKLNSTLLTQVQKVLFDNLPVRNLFTEDLDGNISMIPVANQRGSYIYHCGDEIFLLRPGKDSRLQETIDPTQQGITAGAPLLSEVFFTKSGFSEEQTGCILSAIKQAGMVDEAGHIYSQACTADAVETALAPLKLPEGASDTVYLILDNSPIVNEKTFIDQGIDSDLSKTIYTIFRENGLIDARSNRVNRDLCRYVGPRLPLINLIADKKLDENCLSGIFDKLIDSPVALELNCKYSGPKKKITSIRDYLFEVQRLSNGSLPALQRKVYLAGIDELLKLESQEIPPVPVLGFDRLEPGEGIRYPQALDGTQVDFEGLYGEYNWEIFYHIPMLIADRLKSGQENEAAMRWFQFVFNPTAKDRLIGEETFYQEAPERINLSNSKYFYDELVKKGFIQGGHVSDNFTAGADLSFLELATVSSESIQSVRNILLNYQMASDHSYYWNFRPFRMYRLETLREILSDGNPAMQVYNDHPFDPHAIARLRIGAYEKYTVMQYIDNLIDWADRQFAVDTWESITSATMLYILAYTLLGPKPSMVKSSKGDRELDFAQLEEKYQGDIPQFLICLEGIAAETGCSSANRGMTEMVPFHDLDLYFGVPENAMLMQYWDTVEDRLYKIRNSMNIAGIKRQLALNEPEVNPLELVKAASVGNQVFEELASGQGQPYPYRFMTALGHARMLAAQMESWSASLLSILERQDAEHLRMLTDTSENEILNMTTYIKECQIQEQEETLNALQLSLESAEHRKTYYQNLLSEGLSDGEQVSLTAMDTAAALGAAGSLMRALAGAAHAVPQVGSPFAMTYGGIQVGGMLECYASVIDIESNLTNYISQRAQTVAGYDRRAQEWKQQREQADYDEQNIQKQILATQKRLDACRQELKIHQKNIQTKQEISGFLQSRFTSEQLYQWMAGRMQGILSQAWLLALKQSLIAQDCYQRERDSRETFIQFQYWENAKKGILAGESLVNALNQMEMAYHSKNIRCLEIEKNISLGLMCPKALYDLKAEGKCEFQLTEDMFDYDYPGCFARKIVNISVSIPAVTAPYENIKAVLRQSYHAYVTEADQEGVAYLLSGGKGEKPDCVREDYTSCQQIALSQGMNDSGMFMLNFNDERYLPFEGTGVVSSWTLEMPKETNHFSFNNLTDVIIHMKYTALLDDNLKEKVKKLLYQKYPYTAGMYLNLKQNFSIQWEKFMMEEPVQDKQKIKFPVQFQPEGYYAGTKIVGAIFRCSLKLPKAAGNYHIFRLTVPGRESELIEMNGEIGCSQGFSCEAAHVQGQWVIEVDLQAAAAVPELSCLLKNGHLDPEILQNIEMTILYERRFGNGF